VGGGDEAQFYGNFCDVATKTGKKKMWLYLLE